MTASIIQIDYGKLGDNIYGIEDATQEYCIFSIVDGGWRKNTVVNIVNCFEQTPGYVSPSYKWKNMSSWFLCSGCYILENLTGCESGGVNCGGHFADTCEQCSNLPSMCNSDCSWDETNIICTPSTDSLIPVSDTLCVASSEYSTAFECQNVLDNSENTEWATLGEGIGSWIEFTFPLPVVINQMFYQNRNSELEANKEIQLIFSDGTIEFAGLASDYTNVDIVNPNGVTSIRLTVLDVFGRVNNGAKTIHFYGSASAKSYNPTSLPTIRDQPPIITKPPTISHTTIFPSNLTTSPQPSTTTVSVLSTITTTAYILSTSTMFTSSNTTLNLIHTTDQTTTERMLEKALMDPPISWIYIVVLVSTFFCISFSAYLYFSETITLKKCKFLKNKFSCCYVNYNVKTNECNISMRDGNTINISDQPLPACVDIDPGIPLPKIQLDALETNETSYSMREDQRETSYYMRDDFHVSVCRSRTPTGLKSKYRHSSFYFTLPNDTHDK